MNRPVRIHLLYIKYLDDSGTLVLMSSICRSWELFDNDILVMDGERNVCHVASVECDTLG